MQVIKRVLLFSLLFFVVMGVFVCNTTAQEGSVEKDRTLEGIVEKITEEKEITVLGKTQQYQKLQIQVAKGSDKGKIITVENGTIATPQTQSYTVGDKVLVSYSKHTNGEDRYYITDYVRIDSLIALFILFVIVVVLVGRIWGLMSLIALCYSFFIIFKLILPQVLAGNNPVFIAILGSFFIIPVTFFLSHGVNKKTTIAIVGTILSLIITGVLAYLFVNLARLTGLSSEDASFLQIFRGESINMRGLLLAGIIIGSLGILDDVTVSQSSIVQQLHETDSKLSARLLFYKAMKVGQDHISSMVNTLVLVYTGASLPLLLLFIDTPHLFSEVLNYEIIADEIVRTLVGSIGLILAVPITTALAVYFFKKSHLRL